MKLEWFGRLFTCALLVLVQVLVLNRIRLFDVATPLAYVAFVLHFRRNNEKWATMLWCFVIGLCIDTFANTPGMAAASMTFVGMLQPYLLDFLLSKDSSEELQPSMRTMGLAKYSYYAGTLIFVYCLIYYSIEAFSFFNWVHWIASIGGSAALTTALILVVENLRRA